MKYILLFCILLGTMKINSQNIISNSGFESGSFNVNLVAPPERFDAGINTWESRTHEGTSFWWHSPDWYSVVNSQPFLHFEHNPITNSNYYIYPIEGNKYVGMMDYELIQQKLGAYSELENGISYLLKMKVYLSYDKIGEGIYSSLSTFSNSYLNVYFAKNKVKYKKESGNDDNVCTEKYKKHTTGWGQDYIDVEYFDLANYPLGQWITLTADIQISNSNADAYNWFVIEIVNKSETSSCQLAYVLLDEVSVEQGCDNGCSSTDGIYNIHTNSMVTHDHMLIINGLENITQIKFRFKSLGGAVVTNYFVYNNPANTIGWDGTNTNGAPLANATYFMEIEATNDCGTKKLLFPIQKIESYSYYYNYDSFYVAHPIVSKPPELCCLYNLILNNQILIEDKTLNHPLTYKVQNEIQVGPNTSIPEDNNVIMTAGNNIIFLPPFHSQGNLHAFIEPCSFGTKSLKYNVTDDDSSYYANNDTSLIKINEKIDKDYNSISNVISVYPNPSNGIFEFETDFDIISNVIITNVSGIKIFERNIIDGDVIDLTDYPAGIYFATINSNGVINKVKLVLK